MSDRVAPRRAVELLATGGLVISIAELEAARIAGRISFVRGNRYTLADLGRFLAAERERIAAESFDGVLAKRAANPEPVSFGNLVARRAPGDT